MKQSKNLKERITINVIRNSSSKTYNLKKWNVLIIIGLIIVSFILNILLVNNIKTSVPLDDKSSQIKSKMIKKQALLLEEQKKELLALKNKNKIFKNKLDTHVDQSKFNIKNYILNVIPNGSPLIKFKILSAKSVKVRGKRKKKKYYDSIILETKLNEPVHATADGIVRYVRIKDQKRFGKVIIIAHAFGFETVYAHLNSVKFKLGDIIHKGDIIGYSGKTGKTKKECNCVVPNLYYEVRYATKLCNVLDYLYLNKDNYGKFFKKQRQIKWKGIITMILKQRDSKLNDK